MASTSTGSGARRARSRRAGPRPASSWAGRRPRGELAELVDGDGDLGDRVVEGAADLGIDVGAEGVLGVAQGETDRHQPLLGAVVQVAFDAAPLLVGGGDDPGP